MTDDAQEQKFNMQFYQLILSLHGGAMQQMGKVASPINGKVERDLNQAQATIDLLDMLKHKTQGNLSDEEHKLIDHVLYELRLNFVDEKKKDTESPSASEADKASKESAPSDPSAQSEPKSDATSPKAKTAVLP